MRKQWKAYLGGFLLLGTILSGALLMLIYNFSHEPSAWLHSGVLRESRLQLDFKHAPGAENSQSEYQRDKSPSRK